MCRFPSDAISQAGLYPGESLPPQAWANPAASDLPLPIDVDLPAGFNPLPPDQPPPLGSLSATTLLQIPSIEVDSAVTDLAVVDEGGVPAYETPDRVVGRIPTTANAGEASSVWLFGHLESPIRGEGSVFRDLPEIPQLLREGRPVYAVLTAEDGTEYLYGLRTSRVLAGEDLVVTNSDRAEVVLVTCVPRLIYDKRLVVSGDLVGIKRPGAGP